MALVTLPNGHLALNNNAAYTIGLTDEDINGNIVPMPAGDTITVATAGTFAASLGAVMATIGTQAAVTVNALVVESDANNSGGGITLVFTDTAKLTQRTSPMFDIVVPPPGPAASEGLDLTNIVIASQLTPAAPGP